MSKYYVVALWGIYTQTKPAPRLFLAMNSVILFRLLQLNKRLLLNYTIKILNQLVYHIFNSTTNRCFVIYIYIYREKFWWNTTICAVSILPVGIS